MDSNIYRKVALQRLASPQQFDSIRRITAPREWLGLVAILLLVASAAIWVLR